MVSVYGFMKVTEFGEWLESGHWFTDETDAEFRKKYLADTYGIDGYIVTAELGEIKRVG